MPIVVGHDVNPGLLPYEAAYLSQQQLGQQNQQGNLQAQAAATNARLRPTNGGADLMAIRARDAAGKGPDTYAGMDWQTPIVVTHPDQSQDPNSGMRYDTLYQSQGADPLANAAGVAGASPGFGKLGSREQYVEDNAGVINPNDPFDRAQVGKLQNMPYGTNYANPDFFRNDQELKDRETAKQNAEYDRRQDEQRNFQADQKNEDRLARESEAQTKAAGADAKFGSTAKAALGYISGQRHQPQSEDEQDGPLGNGQGVEDNTYSPSTQKRRDQLIDQASEIYSDSSGKYSPEDKATTLKSMADEMKSMKPLKQIWDDMGINAAGQKMLIDRITGNQKAVGYGQQAQRPAVHFDNQTGQVSIVDPQTGSMKNIQFKPPQNKPDFTPQQKMQAVEAATKILSTTLDHMPTPDEVQSYVQSQIDMTSALTAPPPKPQAPAGGSVLEKPVDPQKVSTLQSLARSLKAAGVPIETAREILANHLNEQEAVA